MNDSPCMDNNRLIVISETRTDFELALNLAFRHHGKAVGWSLWNPKREEYDKDRPEELLGVCRNAQFLVLHWVNSERVTPFPMEADLELATNFAWKWLEAQVYGPQPDHDGSNHKGFIVFNEVWGHVNGDYGAIISIGPAWAMAGK